MSTIIWAGCLRLIQLHRRGHHKAAWLRARRDTHCLDSNVFVCVCACVCVCVFVADVAVCANQSARQKSESCTIEGFAAFRNRKIQYATFGRLFQKVFGHSLSCLHQVPQEEILPSRSPANRHQPCEVRRASTSSQSVILIGLSELIG